MAPTGKGTRAWRWAGICVAALLLPGPVLVVAPAAASHPARAAAPPSPVPGAAAPPGPAPSVPAASGPAAPSASTAPGGAAAPTDPPSSGPVARPVWPGFTFELRYVHSLFAVPVAERFRVDWSGRLVLYQVESTRYEVADYYGIAGARVEAEAGRVRLLGLDLRWRRLPVRAGPLGRRTYHDGACAFPLARVAGEAGTAELAVRWRPWLVTWFLWTLDGRGQACRTSPWP